MDIWTSKNNPEDTAAIENPHWYADNGTPIDQEGDDMEYTETVMYAVRKNGMCRLFHERRDAKAYRGTDGSIEIEEITVS